jgi:hypothetical protein
VDGRRWWFEIPSVEHPNLARAVFDEAGSRGIEIGRLSMGSGTQLLTPDELAEMVEVAHSHDAELFTYISSRNSFEPLVDARAGEQLRGEEAFADAVAELRHCAARGVDGVLIGDVGLLAVAGELRRAGEIGMLQLKAAAAIAPHNAAAAALYERLGATSINVPASALLTDLIAMRSRLAPTTSIDIYIESPDDLGGGLRYREVLRFVQELSPVSLKIGVRNAASLYPYGGQLEPGAERSIREKVRRAHIVSQQIERAMAAAPMPLETAGQ